MVRYFVLCEYAGEFLVTAIWPGCFLLEVSGASAYHTAGYLPWIYAVHCYPIVYPDGDIVLPRTDNVLQVTH